MNTLFIFVQDKIFKNMELASKVYIRMQKMNSHNVLEKYINIVSEFTGKL